MPPRFLAAGQWAAPGPLLPLQPHHHVFGSGSSDDAILRLRGGLPPLDHGRWRRHDRPDSRTGLGLNDDAVAGRGRGISEDDIV